MADNECGCAATSDPVHTLQSYNSKIHSSINKVTVFFFHPLQLIFMELLSIFKDCHFLYSRSFTAFWGACSSYSKQIIADTASMA